MSEIIKYFLGEGWLATLFISITLIFGWDIKLYKTVYSRYNRVCVYIVEIGFIFLMLYWNLRNTNQYAKCLLYISIFLPAFAFVLFVAPQIELFCFNKKWIEEPDPVIRWRMLDTHPVGLTHGEDYDREWRKVSTLIFFGCFSIADVKMEELNEKAKKWRESSKKCKKHHTRVSYYNGMKEMFSDDKDSALSSFKAMEEYADNNVDYENLFTSYMNIGACYARRGDYHSACDSFHAALSLLDQHEREHGYKSKMVRQHNLSTLYYDYVLCLFQVEPEKVNLLLEDYKNRLGDAAEERINWFNVRLVAMRQQNVDHKKQETEIQKFYKSTYPLLMDSKQKCVFIASMARIACDARLNPEGMLNDLHKDFKSFSALPMPEKFVAYHALDYMFTRLGGKVYDKTYRKERVAVHRYMNEQADAELNKYMHSLPAEAIIQRIQCYENLAGIYNANQTVVNDIQHAEFDAVLHGVSPIEAVEEALDKQKNEEHFGKGHKKNKKPGKSVKDRSWKKDHQYNLQKTISYLEEAAKKAEDEGLVDYAFHIRLNIVDEMTALVNMNEDGWPKYPDEMHKQMDIIEDKYLPLIENDKISLAEFAIRLGFFHLLLGEYDKCLENYFKYKKEAVSIARFAPWLREQYLLVSWCVRAICFYNAIKEAQRATDITSLSQEVQDIIKNCLQTTGEVPSQWLARFLHFGTLFMISREWFEADKKNPGKFIGPYEHSWIHATPFRMSVDLTYGQFVDDKYSDRILFQNGYVIIDGETVEVNHPMLMMRSNYLRKIVNSGGMVRIEPRLSINDFDPNSIDPNPVNEKAYQFILSKVDKRCPSIEDIMLEDLRLAEGTITEVKK